MFGPPRKHRAKLRPLGSGAPATSSAAPFTFAPAAVGLVGMNFLRHFNFEIRPQNV